MPTVSPPETESQLADLKEGPGSPVRQLGILRGKIWAAPDAWEPMTEEELALWYDAPLVAEPYVDQDDGCGPPVPA